MVAEALAMAERAERTAEVAPRSSLVMDVVELPLYAGAWLVGTLLGICAAIRGDRLIRMNQLVF